MLENDYDLTTSVEIDKILNEIPIDLISETVRSQVNDPLANNVNYLDVVIDKINVLESLHSENSEAMSNIKSLRTTFFNMVSETISDRFDLGLSLDLDDSYDLQSKAVSLYEFLILRYRKNIRSFLLHYILQERKRLIANFAHYQKKKDVASLNFKKKLKHKDDVIILANLPEIINFILDLNVSGVQFLSLCSDNADSIVLQQMIALGQMDDGFVHDYTSYVKNEYDTVLDSILVDVRMELIDKMSK